MTQISRLQTALSAHLPWHGARLTFLALVLVALFRVETVNLDKLSSVFANRAKPESSYKRLTRFLREFPVDFDDVARAVVSWSQIPQPWTLSLDRTNGSFGTVHFNILMLGIVHEGVAFPLFWTMLDTQGNSHSDERIDLLECFERVFPTGLCQSEGGGNSDSVGEAMGLGPTGLCRRHPPRRWRTLDSGHESAPQNRPRRLPFALGP
jgi:hypothetical protein